MSVEKILGFDPVELWLTPIQETRDPRDGDGDGRIFDGTPQERAASTRQPALPAAPQPAPTWRAPYNTRHSEHINSTLALLQAAGYSRDDAKNVLQRDRNNHFGDWQRTTPEAMAARILGQPLTTQPAPEPAETPPPAVTQPVTQPRPAVQQEIPRPPTVNAPTYRSYQVKLDKIYAAAQRGDIAAVMAVETNATSKTHWTKKTHEYKTKVLELMRSNNPSAADEAVMFPVGRPAKSTSVVRDPGAATEVFYQWCPKARELGLTMADMIGAPGGTTIVEQSGDTISVRVVGVPKLNSMSRRFRKGPNGTVTVYNSLFETTDKGGMARECLRNQVANCFAMGNIKQIDVTAAGSQRGLMNGYYTWFRYGYDAPITEAMYGTKLAEALAIEPGAKTLLDLMRTKRGRDFWMEKGTTSMGVFDLSSHTSRSMRTLKAYDEWKKRKAPTGTPEPETPGILEHLRRERDAAIKALQEALAEFKAANNLQESTGEKATVGELQAIADAWEQVLSRLLEVKDGDGDGKVFDGTPQERPAEPREQAAPARSAVAHSKYGTIEETPRGYIFRGLDGKHTGRVFTTLEKAKQHVSELHSGVQWHGTAAGLGIAATRSKAATAEASSPDNGNLRGSVNGRFKQSQDLLATMTPEMRDGVEGYIGYGPDVNDQLRIDGTFGDEWESQAKQLDKAFETHGIPMTGAKLYRGIDTDVLERLTAKTGSYSDIAFISTSGHDFNGTMKLTFDPDSDIKGLPISSGLGGQWKDVDEVVLERNLTFTVQKKRPDGTYDVLVSKGKPKQTKPAQSEPIKTSVNTSAPSPMVKADLPAPAKNPQAALLLDQTATIPKPPKVGAATYQSYQKKLDAIHAAAIAGDIKAVQAIETNATSKTHWTKKTHQYKQEVIAAMGSGRAAAKVQSTVVTSAAGKEFTDAALKPSRTMDAVEALGGSVVGQAADGSLLVANSRGEQAVKTKVEIAKDFKKKAVLDPLSGDGMKQREQAWSGTVRESNATHRYTSPGLEKQFKHATKGMSPATLIGAPNDARVHVRIEDLWEDEDRDVESLKGDEEGLVYTIEADGPNYTMSRQLYRDEDGEWTIANSTLETGSRVGPNARDQPGLGRKIFKDQIAAARKAGVKKITTQAVGSAKHSATNPGAANGYYTWARYGYSGTLSATMNPTELKALHEKFPGAKDVRDVLATKEGRDWWKANGVAFEGDFDLNAGSRSMQTFTAYLVAKGEA